MTGSLSPWEFVIELATYLSKVTAFLPGSLGWVRRSGTINHTALDHRQLVAVFEIAVEQFVHCTFYEEEP